MEIVVADPHDPRRGALGASLVELGHAVELVVDADAALRICRERRPAVLVADDALRTTEGLAVLEAVKQDRDIFRTAVVLIDAGMDAPAAIGALRRGAQDLLSAEVPVAEVVTRVAAAERTKILQEELTEQSVRLEGLIFGDELTGLPNRRYLLTQLQALVSGATRHERSLSVVMVDVDHFKAINDTYGHAAGDQVLAAVGVTLRERLREEDGLGRLGGEEFLALLPEEDSAGAAVAAEALRHAVAHTGVRYEGLVLRQTVSCGWSTLEPDEDAESLLRRADDALYAAKRAGRDRVRGAASLRPRL